MLESSARENALSICAADLGHPLLLAASRADVEGCFKLSQYRPPLRRARWKRAIPLGGTFRHRSPAAASEIVPKTPRDHLLSARECAAASALSMAAFIFGACPCAARRGGISPAYCRPATSLPRARIPFAALTPIHATREGDTRPQDLRPRNNAQHVERCSGMESAGEKERARCRYCRVFRYARCLARKANLSSRRCSGRREGSVFLKSNDTLG